MKTEQELIDKAKQLAEPILYSMNHPCMMNLGDWREDMKQNLDQIKLIAWILDRDEDEFLNEIVREGQL